MGSPIITPQIKTPVIVFPKTPADQLPATPMHVDAQLPTAADLDAVAAEQSAALATSGPAPSFGVATKADGTGPSLDTTKFDSAGNAKADLGPVGPRGANLPLDVMTDAERAAIEAKTEKRLQAGMSSTAHVDSVGNPKGEFETKTQGHNIHGMRIPDKVDFSKPVEAPALVGPRGKGAQPDTYHGPKPPAR